MDKESCLQTIFANVVIASPLSFLLSKASRPDLGSGADDDDTTIKKSRSPWQYLVTDFVYLESHKATSLSI
jgi:hypothetical protein